MIPRILEKPIFQEVFKKNKVIVLLGPRQVGKTTLLKKIVDALEGRKEVLNGDYLDDQERLKPNRVSLKNVVAHLDYLFIDEAQNIDQIGTTLKLIHDEYPEVGILATGSSSFNLAAQTGEPLTGRQIHFILYPISFGEQKPRLTTQKIILNHSLIYGAYPETINLKDPKEKISYLKQLTADYLLKDIYRQVDVNQVKLADILRLLAFQIGSEVSLNEIATHVQLDVKTVSKYLSYLEQAFVLFKLRGFSRNLRKEISKSQKFFFFDLGIRNAIVNAFNPLELRNDIGKLWENLLVIERMKLNAYQRKNVHYYFWRTYDQKEIDLIEDRDQKLFAYGFKYSSQKKKIPPLWFQTYPESKGKIITPENVGDFLS